MNSIFISHSSRDASIAVKLKTWLRTRGFRLVFVDFDGDVGILPGSRWESELYKLLRTCNAMIVLCSASSESSPWVFAEVAIAKVMGKHVIPIRLDDARPLPILEELQSVDARSDWETALARLDRVLALEGLTPSIAAPTSYQSCFISYSTNDQDFAERLYEDLTAEGVQCWFAPHDIKGGKKLYEQISEAILEHDRVLLILSESSLNSEWVKTEISTARHREVTQQERVLFPIRLVKFETLKNWKCFDADVGKDTAREIREYFIPDFSEWQVPKSYQSAFHSLIRDLRVADSRVG